MFAPLHQLVSPNILHVFFEMLAIAVGVQYYRHIRAQAGAESMLHGKTFWVVVGCITGAGFGNKVVFWLEFPHLLSQLANDPAVWFNGQSMVGGLLGGLLGVELAKRLVGIRESTGDWFVFPVLLGLMIGRVGCFLAGLDDGTYGTQTVLPIGVDFGDGISRHPTQLYEIAFAGLLWFVLSRLRTHLTPQAGLQFKLMLAGYLAWRLLVDFLKPVPYEYPAGLSGIQVVCVIALAVYLPLVWRQFKALQHETKESPLPVL
jgi:phosphatidylglycerol:prolipoprotein diacylglycerol transferase